MSSEKKGHPHHNNTTTAVVVENPYSKSAIWNLQSYLTEELQDNKVDAVMVSINEGYLVAKITYTGSEGNNEIKKIATSVISEQIGDGIFISDRFIEEGASKKIVLSVLLPTPTSSSQQNSSEGDNNNNSSTADGSDEDSFVGSMFQCLKRGKQASMRYTSTTVVVIALLILTIGLLYGSGKLFPLISFVTAGSSDSIANRYATGSNSNQSFTELVSKKVREIKQDIAKLIHEDDAFEEASKEKLRLAETTKKVADTGKDNGKKTIVDNKFPAGSDTKTGGGASAFVKTPPPQFGPKINNEVFK